MIIRFADNTELEVESIKGNREIIQNANRDVLTIEVKPEIKSVDELMYVFKDKNKTKRISEIINGKVSAIIGENYTLYISSMNIQKEVIPAPGDVKEPEFIDINIVKIAQLTYTELLLEQILSER